MKKLFKSKLFLQVIVASMVATLATVGIVGAVTTIGDNITTAGTLTVTGDVTIDTNTLKVDATNNKVGLGTTTPNWSLQISGTKPSIALSDSNAAANLRHWLISSMEGNLYIGTSSNAFGTSTPAALSIANTGNAVFSGTVQATTLTDGTASISSGAVTGVTNLTATGNLAFATASSTGQVKLGSLGVGTTTPSTAYNLSIGSGAAATSSIITSKFCMYVVDQEGKKYYVTLNMGAADASAGVFATSTIPCN